MARTTKNPKAKAPKAKASKVKAPKRKRRTMTPKDDPEDNANEASTQDNKNPKEPHPLKWSPALRKALFEKKGFVLKKPEQKQDVDRKAWWNDERRLQLFMHIVKYKKIQLSEFEWRDIADEFGRSWNGIRLEFSQLMGNYFEDYKRSSKTFSAVTTNKPSDDLLGEMMSLQAKMEEVQEKFNIPPDEPDLDSSSADDEPKDSKVQKRRANRAVPHRVYPAYRSSAPLKNAKAKGFH